MNTKIGIGIGIGIGLTGSVLLWKFFEWQGLLIGFVSGLCLSGIGLILMKRRKVVSCFLASTLAVSPNILAEDFSAGYSGGHCYCFEPQAEDPAPPAQESVKLSVILERDETGEVVARITGLSHPPSSTLVNWDGLNASLVPWGVNLDNGEQYATNGVPATAADVPFSFGDWSNPLAIYPQEEQFQVVLEVATEVSGGSALWLPLAHFSAPAGKRIEIYDSPEGAQTFYRVRLQRAPETFQAAWGGIVLGCGLGLLVGTAYISIQIVRVCAKNKKKFQAMLPPTGTNATNNAPMPPD